MPFGPEEARQEKIEGRKKSPEEEKKKIQEQQENLTQGAIARPAPRTTGNINFTKLPPGTMLLDRYKVIRTVGKGGFGAIYLVEDSAIQDELILKILNPQLSMDDNAIRRFVQELKLTRKITHPNVIRIYDFMDLNGAHAVSMEYFPSQDLGRIIRAGGAISPKRSLRIVAQTLRGLAAAHDANVIHRDIKPANILLGDQDVVKIVDFGLASAGQHVGSRLTKSGLLIGTPEYMAPEQVSGEDTDARSDLYSVGIMLYEMLSGQKPFTAETPVKVLFLHLEGEVKPLGELVEGLPLDIEYLVSVSMARNPADRPESSVAMLEMVERTLADLDSAAA
jgi:serine/threonine-protein kinase